MGSKIIGRTGCPECGFESAHVKRSDKCLYRYCPECGSQHMARSQRQEADLMAKTRPVDAPAPARPKLVCFRKPFSPVASEPASAR